MRDYANPPWCLIPCCLSQIKQQQARVSLITPLWPCQPWFPVVLGILQDYPRQLPPQEDLILSPSNQEFIMQQGTPTLVAWPISGNPSLHKEFLHRLQNYSSLHGATKPTLATTLYLQNGQIGVNNGIEIPLLDL